MESKLIVKFWLNRSKKNTNREHPIYLRVRYNKEFFIKSSGFYTKPRNWDNKAMKFKGGGNEAYLVNNQLETIKMNVFRIFNQLSILGKEFNVNKIKKSLEGNDTNQISLMRAFNEHLAEMEKLRGIDYERSTITKYQNTKLRIKQYLKQKYKSKDIMLNELNFSFISDFEVFLKDEFRNSTTTCYKHYQRFTRVIRKAIQKGYLEKYPFNSYTIRMQKKQIEYLTMEEVNRIEKADFKIDRLNFIRDVFVFCCYTGLASAEVSSLTPENITTGLDKELWLNILRKKTKKHYQIPLLPKALKILEKYKNHPGCLRKGFLLPVPSNVRYNAYLKEIADIAGINKNLTTHLARKTFASTIMLANGVNIAVLSKILGHSSVQITLDSYATVVDELMMNNVKMIKGKFAD